MLSKWNCTVCDLGDWPFSHSIILPAPRPQLLSAWAVGATSWRSRFHVQSRPTAGMPRDRHTNHWIRCWVLLWAITNTVNSHSGFCEDTSLHCSVLNPSSNGRCMFTLPGDQATYSPQHPSGLPVAPHPHRQGWCGPCHLFSHGDG